VPLVVRFAEIPGFQASESSTVRDLGVAEFLSIAADIWEVIRPEFRAQRLRLFETFPGEHLGGTPVDGGEFTGASSVTPPLLRRLTPGMALTDESPGGGVKVHSNHSIEIEGVLELGGIPPSLGVLQLNLYRAWADGTEDWGGAGDAVFEVLKTGKSRFDGLWGLCEAHTSTMIPVLKRWTERIAKASRPKGAGKHRIRWAAVAETGGADEPPITNVYALYRARAFGRPSLLTSNLREEATSQLADLLGPNPDAFRKASYRQSIDHEVDSLTLSPAFPGTADRFQGADLAVYEQGGSEYFVFRDPRTPTKAASDLVRAIRGKLADRVRAHMGEGKEWDAELAKLSPSSKSGNERRTLEGWD